MKSAKQQNSGFHNDQQRCKAIYTAQSHK